MLRTRGYLFTAGTLAITLALLCAGGCAAYQLRGTVVEGPRSRILVVNADDPRLAPRGLGGVDLNVTQDPKSLGRKMVGQATSDGEGHFDMPISSFGAGFLEYDMRIIARRKGHDPAVRTMRLPDRDKRLLIVLAKGRDWNPNTSDQLLNSTLKESEPYLHEK